MADGQEIPPAQLTTEGADRATTQKPGNQDDAIVPITRRVICATRCFGSTTDAQRLADVSTPPPYDTPTVCLSIAMPRKGTVDEEELVQPRCAECKDATRA